MLLDGTSEKIDVVLGSTPSTELDFMASYMVDDGSSLTAENNDGTTSGTTDVAVVGSPGSGEQHLIKWLTVYNPSGNSAVDVTLKMDDGTDEQKIVTRSLGADETLEYSDGQWRIAFSSSGSSYTDEDAQDAVGNNFGTGLNYDDATPDYSLDESVIKDGGAKEIDASEFAGSSGTDGQVLTSTGSAAQWESSSGGSAITLDLGDDGTDESSDLTEIATDFDRNSSHTEPSDDKLLIEPYKIGAPEGYLEPGTLTISNNSTDSDHDIDVTGGAVGVRDFSGNWRVVELADETPAFQIDTTGDDGLINGSSLTADTWYELGVIADSSGSNSPSVVGYTDANRPTASGDLPTGFDLFRAMGSPGRSWWVKTDGSSNILGFEHRSDGWLSWNKVASFFSKLLQTSSPATSSTSIDCSEQIPPTPVHGAINRIEFSEDDDSGDAFLGVGHNSVSDRNNMDISMSLETNRGRIAASGMVRSIQNQEIFYKTAFGRADNVIVFAFTSFKSI